MLPEGRNPCTPLSLTSWFTCAGPASHLSPFMYTVALVCICLPSPSQHLVGIQQPSFLLVFWFTCPSFVLICFSLHIPASCGLLVCVCSPSLFLAPPVCVCQPSCQPSGLCALSALCLCLLVSTTWSCLLGIHS